MGTRRKDYEMNKVRGIRGLPNLISIGCDVDRGGRSEGLCFMWRSYVDVSLLSTSKNHIDLKISERDGSSS